MRIALVTGATSGVGRAIALALAGADHRVLAVGRDPAMLQELAGVSNVTPVALDICDHERVAARLAGQDIDVPVNNAGIMPPLTAFDEMSVADIERTIAVNFTASVVLTNLVAKGMRRRQGGHIFFTGSTAGHAAFKHLAVYGATKAAIGGFADGLRLDLAPHGVRVTEIVPGRTETNLYRSLLDAEARAAMYAGGSAVQPRDIAELVLAVLALPATTTVSRFDIVPTRQATPTGGAKKDG